MYLWDFLELKVPSGDPCNEDYGIWVSTYAGPPI